MGLEELTLMIGTYLDNSGIVQAKNQMGNLATSARAAGMSRSKIKIKPFFINGSPFYGVFDFVRKF